ncbi:hypothetical protein EYC84_005365 [Monilinia fructicola]|uniref:Uncharacterized protein n=1 Tax=Monilinia fructicola TaxID=38448 RepID=A0A5M9K045_MONFR|nr:hypothetical protein EYC84_005365 [Monilinia fructicola]
MTPEGSLDVSELPVLSDSTTQSYLSPQPSSLRVGDLEERCRFDFEMLRNALEETLDTTRGDGKENADDNSGTIEELGANEEDSLLKITFLEVSEEEHGNVEENVSDEDYLYHDETPQREVPGHPNPWTAEQAEEPLFKENLFENPLQALEDQENGLDIRLAEQSTPATPKITPCLLSRTWLTRFLARKPKGRRRMPNRPGKFVSPPGSQLLSLIVHGIRTNGVRPTRRDIELQRHPALGQYVSFSSPLRHCWTYTSSK